MLRDMTTTLLWSALAGGVVGWLWGAISWAALPWHHATFRSFAHDDEAARWFLANCPQSGVFGLPAVPRHPPSATAEQRRAVDAAANARMQSGPVVTAIVARDGFGSVPAALARGFVIYAIAAAVIAWLLMHTTGLSYWQKAGFSMGVGLAAGAICRLPDWNWHGYSTSYTLVCVADHAIGGFLVGLALARIV
jgi:hypothetical protein